MNISSYKPNGVDGICRKILEVLDGLSYDKAQETLETCQKYLTMQLSINNVEFESIPSYGIMMTLDEFIAHSMSGAFIDYDGHGDLATKDKCSNLAVWPSLIRGEKGVKKDQSWIPSWATHVVWYNR